MTRFIRIKTINNLDVMIRASAIFTITKAEVAKHTYIVTEDACGNREQFIVDCTLDEIQAMIDGEPEDKPVAVAELQGSIADQLRNLLGKTPSTLANVAKAAQISTHTLIGFFNELHTLNSSNCERLAEALGHRIVLIPEAKETT